MQDMTHSICLIKLCQITMRKNYDFLFLTTLTMSRVFHRTVLSVILIYKSETTCSILTKFSGNKLSGMYNMLTKFGCQKMVALETVRDSLIFCNARYLRRGSRYCLQNFGNLLSRTKGTVYVPNIFTSELQIFSYNEANFGQGHVNARA